MWEQIGLLHAYHGAVTPEVRMLKLAEETGEAAAALIGMNGWNRRKGICATRDDVLDELTDVIITAAIAMAGIVLGPEDAQRHFEQRLSTMLARAGIADQETGG